MTSVRRRLRLYVAFWFVFQAASLSAFVPRDCCPAHRPPASEKKQKCHETPTTVTCPMRGVLGTPCPMHRAGNHDGGEVPTRTCALRGTCDGPMAALAAFLSTYGPLTSSFVMSPGALAISVVGEARENPLSRLAAPDPPPPRA